jgi:hypothetical protein
MRELDRQEIFATRADDDMMSFINTVTKFGWNIGWVAGLEDNPITAFGCLQMWPGVFSMWLFATDDFQQIGLPVTRLIVRDIVPMLWEAGAHRLEARSMEGHHNVQRWLGTIGARREATLKAYGREGQDFHVYSWERP